MTLPCLQALENTLKPSLSEPDISPRQVDRGCEGGVTLPLARPPLTPESMPSTGVAANVLGQPQRSAGALCGHSPLWSDDMGDDILKLLIARANFYDKAIGLVHVGVWCGWMCILSCVCVDMCLLLSLVQNH